MVWCVVWGLGLRIDGLGLRDHGPGARVQGLTLHARVRYLVQGLGFRVYALKFGVWGVGLRVHGLGYGVDGPGARVQGLGFASNRNSKATGEIQDFIVRSCGSGVPGLPIRWRRKLSGRGGARVCGLQTPSRPCRLGSGRRDLGI